MGDGFPEKSFTEWLSPTRTERDTVQDGRAVVPEQRVILRLVRQHCGVTTLEFQLHTRRKHSCHLSHYAPLVYLGPSVRHRKVDAVCVGLQECHTATLQFAAHKLQCF